MIQIINTNNEIIYTSNKLTLKEAVEEAISKKVDLSGANLRGANLFGVNLRGANLSKKKNFKILL